MPSEYQKWIARDVKPEEKRERTPREKWNNWWYYHKWHILIAIAVVLFAAGLIRNFLENRSDRPDYQIAYIGASSLPEDTAESLQNALAALGEDLNGDGQVLVQLHQYLIYADQNDGTGEAYNDANFSYAYAGKIQLMADCESNESFFFLLEDPVQFQTDYEILSDPDGTLPSQNPEGTGKLWLRWADCPVLRGLPLGDYCVETPGSTETGNSQELLADLYIARRGFRSEDGCENLEGCEALWSKIIEGATP